MPRPTVITDERILAAAREVFLEKGFKASTGEVARRAGVAEGSIFNRFKTKLELFQAAMQHEIDEPPFVKTIDARAGKGDLRQNLVEIGVEAVTFLRGIVPLAMMLWSNPGPTGLPALLASPDSPPLRIMRKLVAFFAAEVKAGRAAGSPELMARVYFGSMQNYVFLEIVRGAPPGESAAEPYVKGLVEILWRGIAPAERKKG
jgi:AcrR family transcriptional regulator